MTTTYRVGITKREGAVDGWVFDLPGCRATGDRLADVVELLPIAIAEYLAWLDEHGEKPPGYDFDYEVVEEVESTSEFCFKADAEPLTTDELEGAIRRMEFAKGDIIAIARPLPTVILEWRPSASSVRADAFVPDARTIREMLQHAAGAETYFVRNILENPGQPPDQGAPADFETARRSTLAQLRALDLAQSGRVFRRQGPRGEAVWSARKVLRRIINHQRFHAREVQQRLCWLALGVPEVIPVSRE